MPPQEILSRFPLGRIASVEPYGSGRMHATFRVHAESGEFVLQKIGPHFVPALADIESVTEHLADKSILTSRLVRTIDGTLSFADGASAWRLMTFIPGTTIETGPTSDQARSGAVFIARFHAALSDYDKPFAYRIPHYRDTQHALAHMRAVDERNASSEKYAIGHPLAEEVMRRASRLSPEIANLPPRALHGDLKLNNLRFAEDGMQAIALIDLDTLGRYTLPLELGDMLRSWCIASDLTIDSRRWQTIMTSYRAEASFMTDDEWRLIPDGFFEITLSLASRYCADAYEEAWFKHDPAYPSLFAQNIERTKRYLALLDDFVAQEHAIRAIHS